MTSFAAAEEIQRKWKKLEKKENCDRCQIMKEIVDGAFKAKRRENVEEKCKQII